MAATRCPMRSKRLIASPTCAKIERPRATACLEDRAELLGVLRPPRRAPGLVRAMRGLHLESDGNPFLPSCLLPFRVPTLASCLLPLAFATCLTAIGCRLLYTAHRPLNTF